MISRYGRRTFARLAALALAFGCSEYRDAPVLRRTRTALFAERFTSGRMDGQPWAECRTGAADSLDGQFHCTAGVEPAPTLQELASIAADLNERSATDTSINRLHATALIDFRSASASRAALDRAVGTIERARNTAPDNASVLNDAAVIHLALGEQSRRLPALLKALDIIDQALRIAPKRSAALFNRALILERLGLAASATDAWNQFIGVEKDSAWTKEARLHVAVITARTDTLTPLNYPQQTRDAFFRLLGEWGVAALRNDSALAKKLHRVGAQMSDSLRALTPDRTVALSVQRLEWSGLSPTRRQRLAQALSNFAQGIHAHDNVAYKDAKQLLVPAEDTLRMLGFPAARWAAFYRAAADVNLGNYDSADTRLKHVLAETSADEPALVGRAMWVRGILQVRQGRYEPAIVLYRDAREAFVRAHDEKNRATMGALLAEALALGGHANSSLTEAYRALMSLTPHRRTYALHNHLLAVAAMSRNDQLRFAAIDLEGEALAVNSVLGKPDALVFALHTQARDLAAVGDSARAFANLDSATVVANKLAEYSRNRGLTDIAFARGQLLRTGNPSGALPMLAAAAKGYRELNVKLRVPTALFELASAERALGNEAEARGHLTEAITLIEAQHTAIPSTENRSAFYETVDNVFDALIDLELKAGRPEIAFAYLERERAAVWRRDTVNTNTGVATVPSLAELAGVVPANTMVLAFAVLTDRVAIWAVKTNQHQSLSVALPRRELAEIVARLAKDLSTATPTNSSAQAQLFARLMAPLARELAGVTQLAIIPDRELGDVPFAALWNATRKRYVVEDFAVRTIPSGAFMLAASTAASQTSAGGSALIVGNPALNGDEGQSLNVLRGASREAREVSQFYPGSLELSGSDAQRGRVVSALGKYAVFHFAGHAIFNVDEPDQSYLALAPTEGEPDGRLDAGEISNLRLSNIRLVVLSACSTQRSRAGHTSAVVGLAYSFLRAGVPATVSTLWDIRDDTAVDVLTTFHQKLTTGETAPNALRTAQLAALASAKSDLRTPAVWAAFVYAGP